MTIEVKKWARAYDASNPDAFTNPQNAVDADGDNGTCACKLTNVYVEKVLKVSAFGFSIPLGSTIDEVYIGGHMRTRRIAGLGFAGIKIVYVGKTYTLDASADTGLPLPACPNQTQCDACTNKEGTNIQGFMGFTVSDLNNGVFDFYLTVISDPVTQYVTGGQWDCVWIRVLYTPPAPPTAQAEYGDGLTWVTQHSKPRKLLPIVLSISHGLF